MKNSQVLKEIIVNADEESLNRAIPEKHIVPENIISAIFQPSKGLGLQRSARNAAPDASFISASTPTV